MTRRLKLASVLVLAVALAVTGFILTRATQNQPTIQIILTPHPDDEVQAWSALSASPNIYNVFITVTNGEATGFCKPEIVQSTLEKANSDFYPSTLQTIVNSSDQAAVAAACREARAESWNHFLDRASTLNRSTALGDDVAAETLQAGGTKTRAWVGSNSARFMADLGDGKVTSEGVENVVKDVLQERGKMLPDLKLSNIVIAAYYNDPLLKSSDGSHSSAAAYDYPHPDHKAVQDAAVNLASFTSEGVWVTTHPFDDRATLMSTIPKSEFDALMDNTAADGTRWDGWKRAFAPFRFEVGSNPPARIPAFRYADGTTAEFEELKTLKHTGIHQEAYGWLAAATWIPGEYNLAGSGALFARHQFFIQIEGGGEAE